MNHVFLQEEIKSGERTRKFEILGKKGKKWIFLGKGSCIGHKFIQEFKTIEISELKLSIKESVEEPIIKNISVFYVD